jgi:CheY-like chemotaxis protein
MARILVVEDEPDIALGLQLDLRDEGHDVEVSVNGEEASRRAREPGWDLILLDVMLPLRDGFEVCRDLRRAKIRTPVLMLTAKAQEAEKVMGLDMGADDYVTAVQPVESARCHRAAPEDEPVHRFGDRGWIFGAELRPLARTDPPRSSSRCCRPSAIRASHEGSGQDDVWGRDVFVTDCRHSRGRCAARSSPISLPTRHISAREGASLRTRKRHRDHDPDDVVLSRLLSRLTAWR